MESNTPHDTLHELKELLANMAERKEEIILQEAKLITKQRKQKKFLGLVTGFCAEEGEDGLWGTLAKAFKRLIEETHTSCPTKGFQIAMASMKKIEERFHLAYSMSVVKVEVLEELGFAFEESDDSKTLREWLKENISVEQEQVDKWRKMWQGLLEM